MRYRSSHDVGFEVGVVSHQTNVLGERSVLTDEDGMTLAIAEAREGFREYGGGEVGCAIVRDGIVLQVAHNEVERRNDPTAHAEMVAIRDLCAKLGVGT